MGIAEEIEKLNTLRENGAISDDEYERAKQSIFYQAQPPALRPATDVRSTDVNTWSMLIHLSQFCAFIMPIAGVIVPIVLWQVKKNESPVIDQHGRIVVNWIISEFIYSVLFILLCFILVGIPLLLVLFLLGLIYPVVGAVRASDGRTWPYPLSIPFFNVD